MGVGHLDEDQGDLIGIGDMQFVQAPRLLLCRTGNRHPAGLELGLRPVDVPHLQPQCTRERHRRAVVGTAVAGELDE
ncbi:hypothetical protein A5630_05855 [Mycolicibacterium mucogenicum]|uniref:Uncharacterized protein n=1 Tax=Mycolicibacterium mucogenicum TaxID=56689 RepID=A0A1A3GNN2_MYCMU|nr:hypothetical protein A5630_05855 [Mycolicibacterium mucogenicum]